MLQEEHSNERNNPRSTARAHRTGEGARTHVCGCRRRAGRRHVPSTEQSSVLTTGSSAIRYIQPWIWPPSPRIWSPRILDSAADPREPTEPPRHGSIRSVGHPWNATAHELDGVARAVSQTPRGGERWNRNREKGKREMRLPLVGRLG